MLKYIKDELGEAIYENFNSIVNNIENRDKNINGTFRVTAESLMRFINEKRKFVDPKSTSFYNDMINNYNFLFLIEGNTYRIEKLRNEQLLYSIRNKGNTSIHGDLKLFDEENVRNTFSHLIQFAFKIIEVELGVKLNKSPEMIDKFVKGNFITPRVKTAEEVIPKEIIVSDLEKLNQEVVKILNHNYEYVLEKYDVITTYVSIMLAKILDDIKTEEYNILEFNDFRASKYASVYKIYKWLEKGANKDKENLIDVFGDLEEALITIRNLARERYDLEIFDYTITQVEKNIKESSKDELLDFNEVARKIDVAVTSNSAVKKNVQYYIESQMPFVVNGQTYYRIKATKSTERYNKHGSKIFYSKHKILENYNMLLTCTKEEIEFLGNKSKVNVIHDSKLYIRPCELRDFIYILTGDKVNISRNDKFNDKFYGKLINYLEVNHCNLLDVASCGTKMFKNFNNDVCDGNDQITNLFKTAMINSRYIIKEKKPGQNVLRYILSNFRHSIIYEQCRFKAERNRKLLVTRQNENLSNLYLHIKCNNFEKFPLVMRLKGHTPSYKNVKECINYSEYEYQQIGAKINSISKEEQTVYVSVKKLWGYLENISEEIDEAKIKSTIKNMVEVYNKEVEDKQVGDGNYEMYKICYYNDDYLYIQEDKFRLDNIIKNIEDEASKSKDDYYSSTIEHFINNEDIFEEKKDVLRNMFVNSSVALLYGEAGTGKTEIITNYIAKLFKDKSILYVSNTHSVKNSLKGKVEKTIKTLDKKAFKTARSIAESDKNYKCDILCIDESKSISNRYIEEIFKKVDYKYVIFTGDIRQLGAIELGNWYMVAKEIINKNSIHILDNNFRAQNNSKLKELWDKVRNNEEDSMKYMMANGYIEPLTRKIFERNEKDEIILCLNYGVEYGINSMNMYMQDANNAKCADFELERYKVNDLVIFNDMANIKYNNVLYNNLKAIIVDLSEGDNYVEWTLDVEEKIDEQDVLKLQEKGIVWIYSREYENKNITRLKLTIDKKKDNDEDYIPMIPFDVSYSASIHKAQGLEYDSVKIIITPESVDKINNEIFYTAITRARKILKIYFVDINEAENIDIVSFKDNVDAKFMLEERDNILNKTACVRPFNR